jgi:hypothetical protein
MAITIHLWTVLTGALCGLAAAYFARGRNRLVAAAVIGAVIAVVMGFLRGLL